ncbi:MAG: TetR/AcrR family transcriptional regulator C-terminal domain-containing protein [Lachnospiraceae bacterium]|nr:TetR/AcrR family transcriptional regulator C-terminal domain-containing protein [Lachnospiraceae bacterium]
MKSELTIDRGKGNIDLLLASSFKEIAAQKPIEKITIKEITDMAGVIRPTFYNHFQDKYELLEWIVKEELIFPMKPLIKEKHIKEAVTDSMNVMLSEKIFYTNANKLSGQNSFREILFMAVKELLLSFIEKEEFEKSIPYKWLTADVLASFISEWVCYAITQWIDGGMKIPVDEIVGTFIYISYHSILELMVPSID